MGLFSNKKTTKAAKATKQPTKTAPSKNTPQTKPTRVDSPFENPTSPPSGNYPYKTLDTKQQEIRVLKIHPGSKNDPICCSIQHTSLLRNTVGYESVSYCWGSSANSVPVVVDGFRISVGYSAAQVLHRMRLPTMTRVIWIDGICINQKDRVEKGHQVALMGQVYSKTTRNVVWLGECHDSPELVKRTIHSVVDNISQSTRDSAHLWKLLSPANAAVDGELLDRHIELRPLISLYSKAWFSRQWVIQEAVLAPRSICYFGSCEIGLQDILVVAAWLNYNRVWVPQGLQDVAGLGKAVNMWYLADKTTVPPEVHRGIMGNLYTLYLYTKHSEAGVAKDKIYALLGMFNHGRNRIPSIIPDYTDEMPTMRVFRDVTRYMIEESGRLGVLRLHPTPLIERDRAWPSWTVNFAHKWGNDMDASMLEPFRPAADVGLRLGARSDNLNVLRFGGITVDSVADATSPLGAGLYGSSQKALETFASVWKLARKHLPKATGRELSEQIAYTLVAGVNWQRHPASSSEVSGLVMLEQYLQKHANPPPDISYPTYPNPKNLDVDTFMASKYWQTFKKYSSRRRYFVTSRGLMGIGPCDVQKSDVVVVLFGGKVLHVLRPGRQNEYKLVGECYVQGIMNGEAVMQHRARGGKDEMFTLV